jgi:hypothetical protein
MISSTASQTHHAGRLKVRPIIPGTPRVRVIHKPAGYAPFATFSCGSGKPETVVNDIVAAQYAGKEDPRIKVVIMETPRVGLVGMAAFVPRPLTFDVLPTPERGTRSSTTTVAIGEAAYIHAIGIGERFQLHRLEDSGRVGSFLLEGMLYHVGEAFDGEIPWTWAYVDPVNAPSQRLFYENGFGYIPPQGPNEESKRILPKGAARPHAMRQPR